MNVNNYFRYYIFHTKAPELSIQDRKKALVATICLSLFSLGIIPLVCRVLYSHRFKIESNTSHTKIRQAASNAIPPLRNRQVQLPNNLSQHLKEIIDKPQTKEEFISDILPKPVYEMIIARQYESHGPKMLPEASPVLQSNAVNWLLSSFSSSPSEALFPSSIDSARAKRPRLYDRYHQDGILIKRICLECNSKKIDAYLIGKQENLGNGRWTLYSHGHTGVAEDGLIYQQGVLDKLNSNYLLFNYPGMGCSEGPATRNAVVAAYETCLSFLEEKIEAKEIICWGTSLGGGIKGTAWKYYPHLQEKRAKEKNRAKNPVRKMRIVSVSDQTFSTLQKATRSMGKNKLEVHAIKYLGYQLASQKSSKNLPHPEIVIHKAKRLYPQNKGDIEHDGLFGGEDCLAGYLLKDKASQDWPMKRFIGTQANHCGGLTDKEANCIAENIEVALQPSFEAFKRAQI